MSLNGKMRLLLTTDPGIDPPAGKIYVWPENQGTGKVLKYRDENGNVGVLGTNSGVQSVNSGSFIFVDNADPANPIVNLKYYRYQLTCGLVNVPSNGIDRFSWGNNSANDGITIIKKSSIIGISCYVMSGWTSGHLRVYPVVNGVSYDSVGTRILLDGTVNSEGGIDNNKALLEFTQANHVLLNPGDRLEINLRSVGWSPTSADVSCCVYIEEIV